MFAKFNLKLGKDDLKFNEEFYNIGLGMYVTQKRTVHTNLDKYLSHDGSLDASSIEADWFPSVNAHVFCHTHIRMRQQFFALLDFYLRIMVLRVLLTHPYGDMQTICLSR